MAPKAFHLFPILPPELRRKIYLLATTPRLLPIYPTSTRRHAPIPTLLHTCHESRQTLISSGYRLAFSRPKVAGAKQDVTHAGEAQWFNPALDTVFFIVPKPVYVQHMHSYRILPSPWLEKRFTVEDAKSVRRLATVGTCLDHEGRTRDRIAQMLRFFGQVEKLELVECVEFEVSEWEYVVESFVRRLEGWELGVVEVGREETAGWRDLLVSKCAAKRFGLGRREWVKSGGDEGGYLGSLYAAFEEGLRWEKGRGKAEWNVPSVRSVYVVSGWGRRKIARYRERYWEVRHERMRMDRRGREMDRPASPFSEMYEEELKMLQRM